MRIRCNLAAFALVSLIVSLVASCSTSSISTDDLSSMSFQERFNHDYADMQNFVSGDDCLSEKNYNVANDWEPGPLMKVSVFASQADPDGIIVMLEGRGPEEFLSLTGIGNRDYPLQPVDSPDADILDSFGCNYKQSYKQRAAAAW